MNHSVETGDPTVLPLSIADFSTHEHSSAPYTSTPSPIGTPISTNSLSLHQLQQQEAYRVSGNISSLQSSLHTMNGKFLTGIFFRVIALK